MDEGAYSEPRSKSPNKFNAQDFWPNSGPEALNLCASPAPGLNHNQNFSPQTLQRHLLREPGNAVTCACFKKEEPEAANTAAASTYPFEATSRLVWFAGFQLNLKSPQ